MVSSPNEQPRPAPRYDGADRPGPVTTRARLSKASALCCNRRAQGEVCIVSGYGLGFLSPGDQSDIDAGMLWIALQQFADYLSPEKKASSAWLCSHFCIPFFNFHALKFNVNTILMPLWAITTFWFLRSYRTHNLAYAMLRRYRRSILHGEQVLVYFFCLHRRLVVAALTDLRRGLYFR